MSYIVIGIIGVLLLVVLYQIATIFDLIGIVKGQKDPFEKSNSYNSLLLFLFMLAFLGLGAWSAYEYSDWFLPESASVHGKWIDNMFNTTLVWTGIIFFLTQILLFYFAFRYSKRKGDDRKALYYPENGKLEMAWTIVPAIVLLGLLVLGAKSWYKITAPAPEDAIILEATGYQFGWVLRYPGKDGKLGKRDYKLIDGTNAIGIDFNDPAAQDDLLVGEIHLPVNKPVLVKIRSRDVLHSFYLPHFRVKMDAVPGTPTRFWFTPEITTAEMRKKLNKPEFNYELACAEMCGAGHFGMLKNVIVETEEEFNAWLNEQQPFYEVVGPQTIIEEEK